MWWIVPLLSPLCYVFSLTTTSHYTYHLLQMMDPRDALPRLSHARRAVHRGGRSVWQTGIAGQGRQSNVDRRKYCQLSSTNDGRQFITLSVDLDRTKLTTRCDRHSTCHGKILQVQSFDQKCRGKYPCLGYTGIFHKHCRVDRQNQLDPFRQNSSNSTDTETGQQYRACMLTPG